MEEASAEAAAFVPALPSHAVSSYSWRETSRTDLQRALQLVTLCLSMGVYATSEHPANSRARSLRETISLMNHPMLVLLRVDCCMYSAENQPNKKPTKLLSSAPWMSGVCS